MKKIIYISQYCTGRETCNRNVSPAACTKIQSILNVLDTLKVPTQILSLAKAADVKYSEDESIQISDSVKCLFLKQSYSQKFFFNALYRVSYYLRLACYMYKIGCKGDFLWIYHVNLIEWLFIIVAKLKRMKVILEVEEIYADVNGKKYKKLFELQVFKMADAYIFPTYQLNRLINTYNKPAAIIEGTYKVEPIKAIPSDKDIIHIIYAGTLDPRKGGGMAAVTTAEFLPNNYHIHILGFGSKEEIKNLETQIQSVQQKAKCKVSFDGLKTGEDYIKFLQSCHIGLSTQNPDAKFNATSFPSKILSYLANGLHVVSVRIPVVEESSISDLLTYYDKQTPQEIAKAILSVDLKSPYDSRARIKALDVKFREDLNKLLQYFNYEKSNK